MELIEIQIGRETWFYGVDEFHTNILDEDGELCLQLNWKATKQEAIAAAEGMRKGLTLGFANGEAYKITEIKRALGIKP